MFDDFVVRCDRCSISRRKLVFDEFLVHVW